MGLNLWVDIGECANGARNSTGRDFGACRDQSFATTGKFGISLRQFHAKGDGLGMYSMAAANGGCELMFHRACFNGRE